jgi:hypothetical protein
MPIVATAVPKRPAARAAAAGSPDVAPTPDVLPRW